MARPPNTAGIPYFRYLDGLRCLSVFWVILLHLRLQGGRALEFIAGHGWMGVDMFFVISGFLITGILLREHASTGRISLSRFYARRALRIWPAYYALLGAITVAALLGLTSDASMILHTIRWPATYLTNAYAGYNRTESVAFLPSWSLSLEEQFYLVWPILLFLSVRRAGAMAITVIGAVTVWRTWLTFHMPPGIFAMRRIFYAPDTRIDVILYGCLLAFLFADARRIETVRRMLNRRWVSSVLAGAFLGAVYINNRWSGHLGNSIGYSVSAIMMMLMIAYIHTVRPAWLLAVLECKPVVWCGRVSYGIYLFHKPLIDVVVGRFGRPSSVAGEVAFALVVYAGAVGLASLSYIFFESRFLRLKDRFSSVRRPQPEVAQQSAA
jgi:peptidoglycan/LPS O-acetylase OafA/YrhL